MKIKNLTIYIFLMIKIKLFFIRGDLTLKSIEEFFNEVKGNLSSDNVFDYFVEYFCKTFSKYNYKKGGDKI